MRKLSLYISLVIFIAIITASGAWLDYKWISYAAQQSQTGTNYQPVLSGVTGSIGGGALLAGACTSGSSSITGALTSMVAIAQPSDGTNIAGLGVSITPTITANGTVTVTLCALVAITPTAKTYNVRVIQ